MSNHILGDEDLIEYLAVMHQKGKTDEFRNYGAPSCPGLYWLSGAALDLFIDLCEQLFVNERPFFKRSSH